jgi:hypothetical protein
VKQEARQHISAQQITCWCHLGAAYCPLGGFNSLLPLNQAAGLSKWSFVDVVVVVVGCFATGFAPADLKLR